MRWHSVRQPMCMRSIKQHCTSYKHFITTNRTMNVRNTRIWCACEFTSLRKSLWLSSAQSAACWYYTGTPDLNWRKYTGKRTSWLCTKIRIISSYHQHDISRLWSGSSCFKVLPWKNGRTCGMPVKAINFTLFIPTWTRLYIAPQLINIESLNQLLVTTNISHPCHVGMLY